MMVEIQKNLAVAKINLSSRRRRKHSAVDYRPSSITIGLLGVIFISGTFLSLASGDIVHGIVYLISAIKAESSVKVSTT